MAKKIDWLAIKNEYITTDASYQTLADKYPVSKTAIANKAKKESWVQLKEEYLNATCTKVIQEIQEKNVEVEVDRVASLLNLTDKAQEQISIAFGQLNKHMDMFGGVHDTDMVDVSRLKKLVSALKDIKDILHEDKQTENADVLAKLDKVIGEVDKLAK